MSISSLFDSGLLNKLLFKSLSDFNTCFYSYSDSSSASSSSCPSCRTVNVPTRPHNVVAVKAVGVARRSHPRRQRFVAWPGSTTYGNPATTTRWSLARLYMGMWQAQAITSGASEGWWWLSDRALLLPSKLLILIPRHVLLPRTATRYLILSVRQGACAAWSGRRDSTYETPALRPPPTPPLWRL